MNRNNNGASKVYKIFCPKTVEKNISYKRVDDGGKESFISLSWFTYFGHTHVNTLARECQKGVICIAILLGQ